MRLLLLNLLLVSRREALLGIIMDMERTPLFECFVLLCMQVFLCFINGVY